MHNEIFMQRCLDLAALGMGKVSPNPMVGCVIVYNNKIIGEGWHQLYGGAHAEVNAVNAVLNNYGTEAESILKESIVYVSLEPCAHFGKTPPCADLLVKYNVKQVVIGSKDPFPAVAGKGIEKLQNAGISVLTGVLEKECYELNRRFFTRVKQQRPYVILKWAETKNGYFAPLNSVQKWITGETSKTLVHKWRSEEDAILIGKNTALADDPQLTVRNWKGRNPKRILIDRNLEVPLSAHIFDDEAPTIVLNAQKTDVSNNITYIALEDMNYYLPQKILFQLHLLDVQSVIIEGGAIILSYFIEAGLWDEARVISSDTEWEDGIKAPVINMLPKEVMKIEDDSLKIYSNTK